MREILSAPVKTLGHEAVRKGQEGTGIAFFW